MSVLYQVLCTLIASYLCFNLGMIFAWPSSTKDLFQSANTTLERPMSETEITLFSSLSSVGALIATPFIGAFLDIIGRKYCAVTASVTSVVAWLLIATCTKVEVILAAMFLSGIGGAAVLIVPVFIGEICQESIRGMMTSSMMIMTAVGGAVSYILGGLLVYHTMVYACLGFTVFGTFMLLFLRDTPLFYMKIGNEQEAQKSFAFYRRASYNSALVTQEMEKLRRAFHPDFEDDDFEEETINTNEKEEKKEEKLSFIRFLRKSRSTRRAILVTMILCTASVFQGLAVLQVNAESIFRQTVPDIPPTISSVGLAITIIVSGLIAAYLVDWFGRRPLMIYGSLGTGACCVALGAQLHAQWGPHWLTALLIYAYTVLYTCGAGTVPFVFLAEVFLPEVKSIVSMLVVEWTWLCNFVILSMYTPLKDEVGLETIFYVFAGISLLTAVICALCQPETNGVSVDVIQTRFLRQRAQNVDQGEYGRYTYVNQEFL